MATIKLDNIVKTYNNGKITALNGITLEVKNNEFFVIFGPAGAGKTSILNMIAGISDPDCGKVYFNGVSMNYREPSERNVAMVFENYALYPHLNIYDNIASPLRSKRHRKPEEEIDREVKRVADMLGIAQLLDRRPSQVSNGQRQRVALGRALIRDPNVFLMDEPIAHLDAKLRNAMRKELKSMQANLHTTTIYVTHDYTEAMSLGDRIAVINKGKICQIGTGNELYFTPATEFVAKLFGDCEINIIEAQVVSDGIRLKWSDRVYPVSADVLGVLKKRKIEKVHCGFRSSGIDYCRESSVGCIKGSIYTNEPLGNKIELVIKVGDDMIRFAVHVNERFGIDEDIYLDFNMDKAIFFDAQTQEYIVRHGEEALREGESVG